MRNVLMFVLTICTFTVFGQDLDQRIERKGFVIGFSVGGGVISISDSNDEIPFEEAQGGLTFPSLKLGWMLNDRLAVLATLPGMTYEYEGRDRSFDAVLPTLQYWVGDRWWVNGGFGLAIDGPALYDLGDNEKDDWHFGCAVGFGTGYEIIQGKKFALDLQTNIHLGRVFMENDLYRDAAAFSVGVGFNWY